MLALMLAFLAAPPIAKGRGFLMSGSTRSDGRESAPVMSSVQVGASSTEVNASNIRPAPKVTT